MGETNPTQPAAPLPPPPPLSYKSAPVVPPAPLEGVDLRFGRAREPGWTSVASIRTASLWHRARDVLVQHQIVCRMVSDPANNEQRTDLLVMASEAEWARDVLRQGIPELGTSMPFPPGGFPVAPTSAPPLPNAQLQQNGYPPAADGAARANAPMAALPVGPLRLAEAQGQSATYTTILVLAFVALILLIIVTIVILCMPNYTNY